MFNPLHWYASRLAYLFIFGIAFGLWAGITILTTRFLASAFSLSTDAEPYIKATCFFSFPFVGYWLYGRYDDWNVKRQFKSLQRAAGQPEHTSGSVAGDRAMRILRTVLIILSVLGAFLLFGVLVDVLQHSYRPRVVEIVVLAVAILALLANVFYLSRTIPKGMPSRISKLVTLWLDVKEKELTDRARK